MTASTETGLIKARAWSGDGPRGHAMKIGNLRHPVGTRNFAPEGRGRCHIADNGDSRFRVDGQRLAVELSGRKR